MILGRKLEASSATSWPMAPFLGLGGGHSQKIHRGLCSLYFALPLKLETVSCQNDEVDRVLDNTIFEILGPWFKVRYKPSFGAKPPKLSQCLGKHKLLRSKTSSSQKSRALR
jgi:hypothetical protein